MKTKYLALGVAGTAMTLLMTAHTAVFAQTVRSSLQNSNQAQSSFARDRNVSVRQRPHPEYDALGVRLGGFLAYPQVTVTGEYNDNVYATDTAKTDDFLVRIAPQLRVASQWSRHQLNAFARGSVNRFADLSTENNEEYAVGTDGRLDIIRGAYIGGGASYAQSIEPRTSNNTASGSLDPVQFNLTEANLNTSYEFNRLRLSARGDYREFDYKDGRTAAGTVVEQDDRDRKVYSLRGRADYALSPATAFFLQGTVNKRDYRLTPPLANVNRNSDGYEILAGANFELGAVWRGELGVGYLSQEFDDARFGKVDGFGARGELEWFPTQLTTVTFNGSRTVEDAGVFGASSYLSTNLGAQVDHELRRNVIVTAQAGYSNDDYKGVDRTDKRWNAGLSATYLLNRRVGVNAAYTFLDQDSKGAASGNDFRVNRLSVGVTGRF